MSTNTHAVELITVGNAAKILGVTTTTLRNWDKNGKLKSFRNPINRYRLYDKKEIERLLIQITHR
jgi:DNA-binding transcriptional MerR regulator